MLRFIKDSLREIKHVVWPTRKETQKFFWLVLALIVAFWIYLFIFSQAFSELLFSLKDSFGSWQSQTQDIDFDASSIFMDEEAPEEGMIMDEEDFDIIIDDENWDEVDVLDLED